MSLNGLDSPDIQNAYQTAVAEAGGWFLLRYLSRDSVELLGRGKNGVSEARNAIAGYSEASPLYGLLLYRRRKILIKYIPEGTSRLLQARTSVHFQDVLERYSPYETLLEITSADGLNDTSLAASFQLHTASPSPSFSRLDEIQEDGEDGGAGMVQSADGNKSSMSNAQRKRLDHLKKRAERVERASLSTASHGGNAGESAQPVERAASPLKTSMSQYLVREESGHTSITPIESPFPAAPGEALSVKEKPEETEKRVEDELRQSQEAEPQPAPETAKPAEIAEVRTAPAEPQQEQDSLQLPEQDAPKTSLDTIVPLERSTTADERSAKPSMDDDPYDLSKYDEWFKPKVKLGPRPVNSSDKTKRPSVARVSALPPSFKPAMKKQEPARPKSSGHGSVSTAPPRPAPRAPAANVPMTFVPPPVPDTPEYKPRPISRGSVKSAPSHKSVMTPDKLRLMKAIELRKKQLRKSQEQTATKPPVEDAPEVPKIPDVPEPDPKRQSKTVQEQDTETATDDEGHPQSTKADSGIEIRSDKDDSQDEDPRDELVEQMPVVQEQGPFDASHALAGEHASPPDIVEPPKEVDDAIEGATSEQQTDDLSSGESQTTERPPREEWIRHVRTPVPRIVMADGSRPKTSDGVVQNEDRTHGASESHSAENRSGSSDNLEEPPQSPRRQNSDLAKRRRGFVEPLQVDVPSGNPDDFLSDDDDLLDELHDATFEQATPIMMARSPNASTFPIQRKASADNGSVRSVNIQRPATAAGDKSYDDRLSPDGFGRSPSSPTPPPEKCDPVTGLARNVSSGISKRIQALEAAGYSSMQARPLTPETSPGGYQEVKERKASAKRPNPFRRHSSNRTNQMPTSHPSSANSPSWNIQHDPMTNRNSVSVTARIVRPSVIDESEQDAEPLQHSELIMNHQRGSAANTPSGEQPPSLNTSRAQSVQSMGSMHTLSPAMSRASGEFKPLHSASRFGRHRQPSSPALDDFPPPPSTAQTQSQVSLASNDENVAPKEGGRTSRFFKRMSTIPFGGSKRKSTAQSQASTTSLASSDGSNKPNQRMSVAADKDTPPAVVVGDLNVQFPDSLLWKRRIVTIDDLGNLRFAIAQAMDIHKGVALKKFPLVEFKAPYAPDLDSQELPYSVVMEFEDGTTLQAACEDAMTQRQVLYLLKMYWKAWAV